MTMRALSVSLLSLTLLLAPAAAQQPQPNPGFTLNTDVRIVLTDVTVTDKKGNLAHGLPASAFHITIDKQPRPILSFVENVSAPTAIAATPTAGNNTYSNEYLLHLPPVLNIVVLDTSNLGITQQMYLAIKFNKFLKQLPADQPLAVYARTYEHLVLIQNFTADHALLTAASAKVMPHLPIPHVATSDESLLYDLAQQLTQVPGHKNVIWFSGGASLPLGSSIGEKPDNLRKVYDQLEAARISVYPVDARGLMVSVVGGYGRLATQHMQMRETAEGTGGQLFSGNFLDELAQTILRQDSSFYTLTFSPKDFQPDNKWHKVHITVEPSGYSLSYRQGYFADGNNIAPPIQTKPDRHRELLLAGGKTVDTPADIRSAPIIFTASIVSTSQAAHDSFNDSDFTQLHPPVPPKRGRVAYFIRYMLPPDAFLPQTVDGHPQVSFEIAALAFNQLGERVGEDGQHVHLTFAHDHPTIPICIEQQIDLLKGDVYLYLAVWDTSTGRLGTIQVPVTVK